MAGAGLFALLDDIATLLDDVAVLTKVAAGKTAGVLGDDLALNAQQVAGVRAERELPVVWAVAMGSFRNKLILVPTALLLATVAPWLVMPLLMIGGAYLCFEGCEKLAHKFLHSKEDVESDHHAITQALTNPEVDLVAFEQEKIKGAIRTDFVLSAEIIVISLGTVREAAFLQQVLVVAGIAVVMTVGVYSLVGAIVKLDDAGIYLMRRGGDGSFTGRIGELILALAPKLMKGLSIVGTAAMFLVGGGILVHGIPHAHDWLHHLEEACHNLPALGNLAAAVAPLAVNAAAGIGVGAIVLTVVHFGSMLKKRTPKSR